MQVRAEIDMPCSNADIDNPIDEQRKFPVDFTVSMLSN